MIASDRFRPASPTRRRMPCRTRCRKPEKPARSRRRNCAVRDARPRPTGSSPCSARLRRRRRAGYVKSAGQRWRPRAAGWSSGPSSPPVPAAVLDPLPALRKRNADVPLHLAHRRSGHPGKMRGLRRYPQTGRLAGRDRLRNHLKGKRPAIAGRFFHGLARIFLNAGRLPVTICPPSLNSESAAWRLICLSVRAVS
jgi:hypothetical protein